MNGVLRNPRGDRMVRRALRDATEFADGYAEKHPWQLAAAGAALGVVGALLLRRFAGRRHAMPRDYSDGG